MSDFCSFICAIHEIGGTPSLLPLRSSVKNSHPRHPRNQRLKFFQFLFRVIGGSFAFLVVKNAFLCGSVTLWFTFLNLEKTATCRQIVCMKTVTYPLRLPKDLYKRVEIEAGRRKKKLSETFRDLISYGFKAMPSSPDTSEVIAQNWDKLGPAPEVLYDKLLVCRGGRFRHSRQRLRRRFTTK